MFELLIGVAFLGAFAVFVDPSIAAAIVSVYIIVQVGWIIAWTIIFALAVFAVCFFTYCAVCGHPNWLDIIEGGLVRVFIPAKYPNVHARLTILKENLKRFAASDDKPIWIRTFLEVLPLAPVQTAVNETCMFFYKKTPFIFYKTKPSSSNKKQH